MSVTNAERPDVDYYLVGSLVESELHDRMHKIFFQYENHVDHHPIDQGTTEALSKHWMPLDEFTDLTMEGLQGGGFQNMVPTIKNVWDQVEKPKLEMIARAREMFSKK